MTLLRKSTPGADSFGHEWKHEKSVVEVEDWQAAELLKIKDAGFTVVDQDGEGEGDSTPRHAPHESETPTGVRFAHAGGRAEAPEGAYARAGQVQQYDAEHPPLTPANQSLAPNHAYADDRDRPAGEQRNHEVWDALADKREEELDREAEIQGQGAHDEAIKRAVVDAEQAGQVAPVESGTADVTGGEGGNVLEPAPSTGITAADATGGRAKRGGGKPRTGQA